MDVLCTLMLASRYMLGWHPSTGKLLGAGGSSDCSTADALAKAPMAIPFQPAATHDAGMKVHLTCVGLRVDRWLTIAFIMVQVSTEP